MFEGVALSEWGTQVPKSGPLQARSCSRLTASQRTPPVFVFVDTVAPCAHLQEALKSKKHPHSSPQESQQTFHALKSQAEFSNSPTMDETLSMLSAHPQAAGALAILVKLSLNVIANPQELKFRRVNLANPVLSSRLFSIPGGSDVLKLLGFMPDPTDPTFLLLPEGLDLPADLVGRLQELEAAVGPPPPPRPRCSHLWALRRGPCKEGGRGREEEAGGGQ